MRIPKTPVTVKDGALPGSVPIIKVSDVKWKLWKTAQVFFHGGSAAGRLVLKSLCQDAGALGLCLWLSFEGCLFLVLTTRGSV